jgi:HD-GYP domain-containing protein (c-di-GMP phosphodiesterase class II)
VVKELSKAVEVGGALDGNRSREAATQITESVVRNPDAMSLLVKLQEKSGEVLSRAVQISVMMTVFGRFLQLPQDRLEILGMLGLLQDVGKLKLPAALAAHGPLNPREVELYRAHVDHTVEILSSTPGLPHEFPGLASLHHERFDGSGYPRGVRGDAIALAGQIAGIVDAYDMLTAPQPFGENLSPTNALSVIYKGRGTQFQPALVEQFIQCIGVYPVGGIVELNSGEVAVVIAQHMVRRLQPRVMVVQDANGVRLSPYKMLDLMKEPKVRPDEPYRIVRALDFDAVKVDPKELFL